MHRSILVLTLSVAGAGAAWAQANTVTLDADGDGKVTQEEFATYRESQPQMTPNSWASYDANSSGGISEDEFSTAEFDRYDLNDNSLIDESEYQARFGNIAPPLDKADEGSEAEDAETAKTASTDEDQIEELSGYATALSDYDGDGDSLLNPGEFWRILSEGSADGTTFRASFADYDTDNDGEVTAEEFGAGEFRRYDRDGDGALSAEEMDLVVNGIEGSH